MLDNVSDATLDMPLLQRLSEEVRTCLLSRATVRHFDRGATICLQDEPAQTLKIVVSGWVKLYRVSTSGNEAVLAILEQGESFDEVAALQKDRSPSSAEAVSDCTLMYLDLAAICSCTNARTEIAAAVLGAASDHLGSMMKQIEQLKVQSGVQRLSEYLLDQCDSDFGSEEMQLPYEKVVLAGKLGMKPESLSRAFAKLKKIGVESELKNVRVRDIDALRSFSDGLRPI